MEVKGKETDREKHREKQREKQRVNKKGEDGSC